MRYTVLLALASILLEAPLHAESESWVQVAGGAFVIHPKELERIHASLQSQVTEAAKVQGTTLPPWRKYLLQYRGEYVKGKRAIEIHGSCERESHVDIRRVFVGDEISDGGTCYFTVFYLVDSGRYSNVAFHGYA